MQIIANNELNVKTKQTNKQAKRIISKKAKEIKIKRNCTYNETNKTPSPS